MRLASVLFAVSATVLSPLSAQADEVALDLSPMTAPAVRLADMAAMDREFGRYRLTPLGVRNTIDAAGSRFTDASDDRELSGGSFALAVDALRDWERQYPHDPMVPRYIARVAHVYARLHSDCARGYAERTMAWIRTDYPQSPEATGVVSEVSALAPGRTDGTFADLQSQPAPVSQDSLHDTDSVETADARH